VAERDVDWQFGGKVPIESVSEWDTYDGIGVNGEAEESETQEYTK